MGRPVRGAEVTIDWPRGLGGGGTVVHTDRAGHYVAARAVRTQQFTCDGFALTVRASGFASAYSQRSDTTCGRGVITIDFKLFPIQR